MKPTHTHAKPQRGVMLLEVLMALLVFSVGVLGLVGLQASSMQQSTQSRYRTEAMLLANDLTGQMWVAASRTPAALAAEFASAGGGASYLAWKARVTAALPGASSLAQDVVVTSVAPLDAIVNGASAPSTGLSPTARVTVTLRWKPVSDGASDLPRQYVSTTEFRE